VRKPRLFISHSSKDDAVAKALCAGLSEHFDVWLDAFELRNGARWQDAIEAQIASCHCAVVLLSPHVREKPDWVNAEAFAFSMRMRVYDPGFRMVPVLLDGFTEAELTSGPLAKSKLDEIQAPSMTSANLDIPAIMEGLEPILKQYQALLPFQEVALSLAALIERLGSNAQEIIATKLGLELVELQGAANRERWLAAALLRADRLKLEDAHLSLAAVAPGAAKEIFRLVAPYTWVDTVAAGHITSTGLSAPPRPTLAMNATRRETPRLYVRRASLQVPAWTTFDCEAAFASGQGALQALEQAILDDIRKSLADTLGHGETVPSDAVLNADLEATPKVDPVFVLLPSWFGRMGAQSLQNLRAVFPRLSFVICTPDPQPDIDQKFPPVVTRLPELKADEERKVYQMYNRCIKGESFW
jgi:hypothetical protein